MTRRDILIGLAIVAALGFASGLQFMYRYSQTLECYYSETRSGPNLLADTDEVWDACWCAHMAFPFCR